MQFLRQHQRVSYGQKVDVFSFGVTMYEVISHRVPWDGVPIEEIFRRVHTGERPSTLASPEDAPDRWVALMKACWDQSPDKRPEFDFILKELRGMSDSAPGRIGIPRANSQQALGSGSCQESYSTSRREGRGGNWRSPEEKAAVGGMPQDDVNTAGSGGVSIITC